MTQTLPARQEQNALLQPPKDVGAMLSAQKDSFKQALGQMVPIDYFVRVATTALRKNPLLAQCTQLSLLGNLMDLAQLGLVPESMLGEAYLIPFRNNKANCYEAQLIIGYRGLTKLLRRNEDIKNLTSDIVCEKDKFTFKRGTTRVLEHEPFIGGDRGAWLGAYAFVAYANGGEDFEFVPAEYIERIKKQSRGSDDAASPWNNWPEQMWRKTAIRQLMKQLDLSPDAAEAYTKDLDVGAIDVPSFVTQPDVRRTQLAAPKATTQPEPQKGQAPAETVSPPPPAAPAPEPPQQASAPPPATKAPQSKAPAPTKRKSTRQRMSAAELAKENERLMAEMKAQNQANNPAPPPEPEPPAGEEPDPGEGGGDESLFPPEP